MNAALWATSGMLQRTSTAAIQGSGKLVQPARSPPAHQGSVLRLGTFCGAAAIFRPNVCLPYWARIGEVRDVQLLPGSNTGTTSIRSSRVRYRAIASSIASGLGTSSDRHG
jgi:hypothetical protein